MQWETTPSEGSCDPPLSFANDITQVASGLGFAVLLYNYVTYLLSHYYKH